MYEQLTFPLNVYAKILEFNNEPVKYLHFGLFQDKQENVYTAQQRSTHKILKYLPRAPASILEIGIGLGTTQHILLDKGYNAHGITPDQSQIDIAMQRIGDKANLTCIRFEDFNDNSQFDCVLTQESAQYIDLLQLIPKASQILKQNGYFILIDEVSLRRSQDDELISLHNPEHIKYLAKCCGLEIMHEESLGRHAEFTMTYLLEGLNTHWNKILSETQLSETFLVELKSSIHYYIDKYNNNDYGYHFLVFKKKAKSTLGLVNGIQYLTESHFESFQSLFKDVFSTDIDERLYHWKYHKIATHSLGYWENNKLIGHYGGFSRHILFFGKKNMAIQIGDTMVAKDKRSSFTKNGVFHQLARNFLYRFIGYGSLYKLGFGFPGTRVMKLAEKLDLYANVGKFTRLDWKIPKRSNASLLYKIRPVSAKDSNCIDKLWSTMAEQCNKFIIGIRNWEYINYRFLQSPLHQYHVLKIESRFTGQLLAIMVLRIEDKECKLIDFVCKQKHIPLIINSAMHFTSRQNKASLSLLISDNLRFLFNKVKLYTEIDPSISIPHCTCTDGPSIKEVKDKWWLLAGDSDCM